MNAADFDWQDRAACRPADLFLFFGPEIETDQAREDREAKAKAICAGCPVRRQCLSHAVVTPVQWGVWGQAGERERAQIRRNYLRRQRGYEKKGAA